MESKKCIGKKDLEWVLEFGKYSPRLDKIVEKGQQVGCINGLAVAGNSSGMVIDIEVCAIKSGDRQGDIKITGIIEEEEMDNRGQKLKKTSSAKASVENVMTVLKRFMGINYRDYEIHLNFPGGVPIDGPSAGVAMVVAVFSAIRNIPVNCDLAVTGEISIRGKVKPVGGVAAKIEAARLAGIKKVIIPAENWQEIFSDIDMEIITVDDITEVFESVFGTCKKTIASISESSKSGVISASALYNQLDFN